MIIHNIHPMKVVLSSLQHDDIKFMYIYKKKNHKLKLESII